MAAPPVPRRLHRHGDLDDASAAALYEVARRFRASPNKRHDARDRGFRMLCDYLTQHPGRTWQQRWEASELGTGAVLLTELVESRGSREHFSQALGAMYALRVIRPTLTVFRANKLTHQLPDALPMPNTFDPDRFLGEDAKAQKSALIGFGGGAHRCLGVGFARLEMRILLARFLTELDMELVHGTPVPVKVAASRWPQSPCTVRYRTRNPDFAAGPSAIGPSVAAVAAAGGCPFA